MSQVKSKNGKKSVSFTVQPSDSHDDEHPSILIPGDHKSLASIPLHLVGVLLNMFSSGLTEKPLEAMASGALVLCICQLLYGYVLSWATAKESSGKQKKSKKESGAFMISLYSIVVSLLLTPAAFVVLVLFGAPLYGNIAETYVLGIHLSMMIIQPLLVIFKLDFDLIYSVAKSPSLFKLIYTNPILCSAFLGVLGTWFGVIPIPLDWDRPWQQWPITLLTGGYAGCLLGSLIGLIM